MDSLRSPARSTFGTPRPRPGGPRRPATFKASPSTSQGFTQPSSPDEAAPSYSGRESPAYSSFGGSHISSPMASTLELQAAESPAHAQPGPSRREQGVQVSPGELSPPSIISRPSTPSISRSTTPAVKIIAKPPTLTRPPPVNFEATSPITWRGMTMETAQWTLSSGELQDIVSRAIRRTAQESYIRILSIKTLDEELKVELERLETVKATTQAQYRFNTHRRTNLLQSLLALAGSDSDPVALGMLVTQLADVTAACDKYMLQLLEVADHKAQIQHVQDVHISSALAMALRKLNASYAKRTTELRQSREQIEQLKGELEDAWKEAEEMAQDMDDLNNFQTGFSSEDIDDDDDERRVDDSVRLAEVIGITGTAVAMKAKLTRLKTDTVNEQDDAASSRQRRVSAARKRSSRASKASLRIPRTPRKGAATPDHASVMSKASGGSGRAYSTNMSAPPLPVPKTSDSDEKNTSKADSFLEMAPTRPATPTAEEPPPLPAAPQRPTISTEAQPDNDPPAPSIDHVSTSSKHLTLDFDIPPINIHPAEEEAGPSSRAVSRRVHSMQPSPVARTPPEELRAEGSNLKRATSEHRAFDGWPWGGAKNARRRSMPLSVAIEEEIPPSHRHPEGRRSLSSPRVSSFSPPLPEARSSVSSER